MPALSDEPPAEPVRAASLDWPAHPDIQRREPRNLRLLVVHQIIFRVGWIFKTESVIVPAFLDAVSGAGWVRGCLPVLNRLGQAVPPVFCAHWLGRVRRKKLALAAFAALMALPLAAMSGVWLAVAGQRREGLAAVLLGLYAAFSIFLGMYLLTFGTVQGKLIRPMRRGRLLMMSTAAGTIPAMLLAWWLLGDWLRLPDGGFGYIFAFTAVCFLASAMVVLFLGEPADAREVSSTRQRGSLAETWDTLRRDANLRRLVVVAVLFSGGSIIFPHYQAFAREELRPTGAYLMVWVITQNAAVGALSLVVGPLADAWGNRLTLRVLLFGTAVPPLAAISLNGPWGARLFWMVFIPLGMTPLVTRILMNYALEICEPADHPRYLSTLSLGLVVPFLLAPAVGAMIDVVGFRPVFLAVTGSLVLGALMTFRLDEPRHRAPKEHLGPIEPGGEP